MNAMNRTGMIPSHTAADRALRLAALALAMMIAGALFARPGAAGEGRQVEMSEYAYSGGDYKGIDLAAKSVFYIEMYGADYKRLGSGSGFVMFDEGLLVTNQHVIKGTSYLIAVDDDGREYILDKVAVSDQEHDIAILLFPEGKYYRPLPYDPDFNQLKRGQPVLAIGSPKGLPGTVSDGIISAFPKFVDEDTRYIQITAPISHGSSGGCLLNEDLQVIGVTSSGVDEGQNLGFAIPVFIVEKLYQQWNRRDTVTLGTEKSWDTVGQGLHSRVSGSVRKPQSPSGSVGPAVPALTPLPTAAQKAKKQLSAGQMVTFGKYPQTAGGKDKTPIEWLVLEVKGSQALLLSRYGLDHVKETYDHATSSKFLPTLTWKDCKIRKWLNSDFWNTAFTAKEQKAVLTTNVDNSKKQGCPGVKRDGGQNTKDKLFLLSYAEANKYLGVAQGKSPVKARMAPTAYAVSRKVSAYDSHLTEDGKKAAMWTLRSPGEYDSQLANVFMSGGLSISSLSSWDAYTAVRPAMWVDLTAWP